MKHPSIRSSRTSVLRLVLLCVGVFLLAATQGCQKESKPKEEKPVLVSVDNLQTAYAREKKQSRMYGLFSTRAGKEKYKGIAALYKALERSEGIHAALHTAMMRKNSIEPAQVTYDSIVVGTTMQTVKMALSFEELEYGSMYPNLARTAGQENFQEGVDHFTMIHAVEERHVQLLREAQDKAGSIGTKYLVCPGCGYIITSDATEECPVCKTVKAKFEKM